MLFDYNNKSEKSIYDYAKKLEGMTFREVLDEYKDSMYKTYDDFHHLRTKVNDSPNISYLNKDPGYIYNPKAKGQLGGLLENCYFGYKPNSDPHADFFDVGVELKSTPIEKKNNGGYRAGERLSITNISFEEPVEDDFYKSHVWEKIKRILLIQYLRYKSIDRLDYMIEFVNLFTPPKEDLKIIIDDYNAINKKIKQGKAHELSEGDTMYLGACTKGATAKKSMRPQYYGDHELAKKRNYCFKTAYMNFVLKNYILKNNVPYESIVKEKIDSTVQDYILNARPASNCKEVFLREATPKIAIADAASIGDMFRRYQKKAGIARQALDGKGFHGLRRRLAKKLLVSGSPLLTVSQILGHDGIDSARQYLFLNTDNLKECALDFSGIEIGGVRS